MGARRAMAVGVLWAAALAGCQARSGPDPAGSHRGPLVRSPAEVDVVPPITGPAPRDQVTPALAVAGAQALVAWQDQRAGGTEIFASLWAPRGVPSGVSVSPLRVTRVGSARLPSVASDGTNYLVAWRDDQDGGASIRAARVSPAGAVLDPAARLVAGGSFGRDAPRVGFDGVQYVAAWEDARAGGAQEIYVGRVSQAGAPLDGSGFRVSTDGVRAQGPAVPATSSGGLTLVAWAEVLADGGSDLLVRRMNSDAVLQDPAPVLLTRDRRPRAPAVAAADGGWVVAWVAGSASQAQVMAGRVLDDGGMLDGDGVVVGGDGGEVLSLSVADVGRAHVVTWLGPQGVLARELGSFEAFGPTAPEVLLQPESVAPGGGVGAPAAPASAAMGTRLLAAWSRAAPDRPDIEGRVLEPDAGVDGPTHLSPAAAEQGVSGAAAGAGVFLVAFREERSGQEPHLFVARLNGAGEPRSDGGVWLSSGYETIIPGDVASDGTRFLVTWGCGLSYQSDVRGTLVSADGTPAPGGSFAISASPGPQTASRATFNGNYLVVWSDARFSTVQNVYATWVTPQGTVTDPDGLPVQVNGNTKFGPAVASGAGVSLVVWPEIPDGGPAQLFATRFFVDGGSSPAGPAPLVVGAGPQFGPGISFDGARFLVVYEESGGVSTGVRAVFVDPASGAIDPDGGFQVVGANTGAAGIPTVAFDGTHHVVVVRTRPPDRYVAVRVGPEGQVVDLAPVRLLDPGVGLTVPRLASDGAGRTVVTYQRYVDGAPHDSVRVRAVSLLQRPNGKDCAEAAECASGYCVQGVCCDTSCGGGKDPCLACSAAAGAERVGTCGAPAEPRVCRPAAGPCDHAETCGGAVATCPVDVPADDGAACPGGVCASGACVPVPDGGGSGGGAGGGQAGGQGGGGGSAGPREFGVGCGCAGGGPGGLVAAALAWAARLARRRQAPRRPGRS